MKNQSKFRRAFNLIELLVSLGLVLTETSLAAADTNTQADSVLVIPCDGTPREQSYLQEQTNTWVFGQMGIFRRSFGANDGMLIYRVPTGRAQVRRMILKVDRFPYRLEFSADGAQWQTLNAPIANSLKSTDFTNNVITFTDRQAAAACASGYAWFRIEPAENSSSEYLQLQSIRVEVRGASFAPEFVPLNWRGQIAALAAGPMMILVGVLTIGFVWWRWHTTGRLWGGALLWTVSVALKFMFAALTLGPVYIALHAMLPSSWAGPIYWSYAGLLTGIFECGIFLTIIKRLRRKMWTWHDALAMGLGFAAIEAVAVGVYSFSSACLGGNDAYLTTWPDALAGVFDRLITFIFHPAAVVMILYAVINRKWLWFALSFAYKSAIDTVAAWLIFSGATLISYAWRVELVCMAPFVIPGLLAIFYIGRKWKGPSTVALAASPS